MAMNTPTSLKNLDKSSSESLLSVKVDRIIHRYVERISTNNMPRFLEPQSVDLIVFDTSKDIHIIVRINSVDLMDNHCWKLTEGACYNIGRFLIRDGGEGVHQFFHIAITERSTIAPIFHDPMPKHSFILKMVDDNNWWGNPITNQIIDVCGILKSYQRTSNYRCRGIYSMSLILELEDRRQRFLIRCILQGNAYERTLPLLENLNVQSGVFVIVQYAQMSRKLERGVELSTVLGATRVFVDPNYPEVSMAKNICLGH